MYLSKMLKPEHATAGHSMFLLDNLTLLIYGVTKKEILLFTKLVPQADCCDLGDESTINQTDLIIPVPWVKCEGIYKKVDAPILYWLEGDAQRKIYLQKM